MSTASPPSAPSTPSRASQTDEAHLGNLSSDEMKEVCEDRQAENAQEGAAHDEQDANDDPAVAAHLGNWLSTVSDTSQRPVLESCSAFRIRRVVRSVSHTSQYPGFDSCSAFRIRRVVRSDNVEQAFARADDVETVDLGTSASELNQDEIDRWITFVDENLPVGTRSSN